MASKEGWGDLRQLILPFYNKGKEKPLYLFRFLHLLNVKYFKSYVSSG